MERSHASNVAESTAEVPGGPDAAAVLLMLPACSTQLLLPRVGYEPAVAKRFASCAGSDRHHIRFVACMHLPARVFSYVAAAHICPCVPAAADIVQVGAACVVTK